MADTQKTDQTHVLASIAADGPPPGSHATLVASHPAQRPLGPVAEAQRSILPLPGIRTLLSAAKGTSPGIWSPSTSLSESPNIATPSPSSYHRSESSYRASSTEPSNDGVTAPTERSRQVGASYLINRLDSPLSRCESPSSAPSATEKACSEDHLPRYTGNHDVVEALRSEARHMRNNMKKLDTKLDLFLSQMSGLQQSMMTNFGPCKSATDSTVAPIPDGADGDDHTGMVPLADSIAAPTIGTIQIAIELLHRRFDQVEAKVTTHASTDLRRNNMDVSQDERAAKIDDVLDFHTKQLYALDAHLTGLGNKIGKHLHHLSSQLDPHSLHVTVDGRQPHRQAAHLGPRSSQNLWTSNMKAPVIYDASQAFGVHLHNIEARICDLQGRFQSRWGDLDASRRLGPFESRAEIRELFLHAISPLKEYLVEIYDIARSRSTFEDDNQDERIIGAFREDIGNLTQQISDLARSLSVLDDIRKEQAEAKLERSQLGSGPRGSRTKHDEHGKLPKQIRRHRHKEDQAASANVCVLDATTAQQLLIRAEAQEKRFSELQNALSTIRGDQMVGTERLVAYEKQSVEVMAALKDWKDCTDVLRTNIGDFGSVVCAHGTSMRTAAIDIQNSTDKLAQSMAALQQLENGNQQRLKDLSNQTLDLHALRQNQLDHNARQLTNIANVQTSFSTKFDSIAEGVAALERMTDPMQSIDNSVKELVKQIPAHQDMQVEQLASISAIAEQVNAVQANTEQQQVTLDDVSCRVVDLMCSVDSNTTSLSLEKVEKLLSQIAEVHRPVEYTGTNGNKFSAQVESIEQLRQEMLDRFAAMETLSRHDELTLLKLDKLSKQVEKFSRDQIIDKTLQDRVRRIEVCLDEQDREDTTVMKAIGQLLEIARGSINDTTTDSPASAHTVPPVAGHDHTHGESGDRAAMQERTVENAIGQQQSMRLETCVNEDMNARSESSEAIVTGLSEANTKDLPVATCRTGDGADGRVEALTTAEQVTRPRSAEEKRHRRRSRQLKKERDQMRRQQPDAPNGHPASKTPVDTIGSADHDAKTAPPTVNKVKRKADNLHIVPAEHPRSLFAAASKHSQEGSRKLKKQRRRERHRGLG